MVEANSGQANKKAKKDFLNLFLEVFGFVRIVASPLFIGLATGFGIYISNPDHTHLFIAVSIAATGLIIGIIWATKVWRKKNTLDYITTAKSPDFDKFDRDDD